MVIFYQCLAMCETVNEGITFSENDIVLIENDLLNNY